MLVKEVETPNPLGCPQDNPRRFLVRDFTEDEAENVQKTLATCPLLPKLRDKHPRDSRVVRGITIAPRAFNPPEVEVTITYG